jgi:hypothetical protein
MSIKPKKVLCVCIGCGCDDLHACRTAGFLGDEACCWLLQSADRKLGVCSSCPSEAGRFKKGDRKLSARAQQRVDRRARRPRRAKAA